VDIFEQMDSEIITHAAFNMRKSINNVDAETKSAAASKSQSLTSANHLHPSRLDYDLKTVIANKKRCAVI